MRFFIRAIVPKYVRCFFLLLAQSEKLSARLGAFGHGAQAKGITVDIIVEGKITKDEGMTDVIQTVLDLKNLDHAILRISSNDDDVKGRIAFSGNGYILGGRAETGETGYPAVRKLLGVNAGNFAILDPGRTHIPETNQTLWINAEKLIGLMPNLPDQFDSLVEGDAKVISAPEKVKTGHINLHTKEWKEDAQPATVADKGSKARKFDPVAWQYTKFFLVLIIIITLVLAVVNYGDALLPYFSWLPFMPKPPE